MRAFWTLVVASALAGCPAVADNPNLPSCDLPDSEQHDVDTFAATVGGDAWTAPAVPPGNTWQLTGTGFQTSSGDGTTDMTVRLTSSSTFEENEDGTVDIDLDTPIQAVFDDRETTDFQLGNQNLDGGDTSLTIDSVTFHTNQDGGGGFLRLGFEDGEEGGPGLILGCFFYSAGEAQGDDIVDVEGGAFILSE